MYEVTSQAELVLSEVNALVPKISLEEASSFFSQAYHIKATDHLQSYVLSRIMSRII
jgi:hypothetical protein